MGNECARLHLPPVDHVAHGEPHAPSAEGRNHGRHRGLGAEHPLVLGYAKGAEKRKGMYGKTKRGFLIFFWTCLPELKARNAHQIINSPMSEFCALPIIILSRCFSTPIRGPSMIEATNALEHK